MNMIYNLVDGSSKETYLDCWANSTKENIQAYEKIVKPAGKSDAETQDAYNKWKQQMEANKIKGGLGAKEEETDGDSTGGDTSGGNPVGGDVATPTTYTIYVGDSRMVGVCKNVTSDSEKCIAEVNTKYSWLEQTALPKIKEELKSHSNANVVIYMGTNDITAYNSYATLYKKIATDYSSAKVVAVSVTPVEETKAISSGSTLKNKQVTTFNDNLKKALSGSNVKYCDVKNQLRNNVGTEDGIHHTASVYKMIYNEMKNCL